MHIRLAQDLLAVPKTGPWEHHVRTPAPCLALTPIRGRMWNLEAPSAWRSTFPIQRIGIGRPRMPVGAVPPPDWHPIFTPSYGPSWSPSLLNRRFAAPVLQSGLGLS